MRIILLLLLLVSYVLCDLNYRYLYYKYKVLYKSVIYIEENNVRYDGIFIYNTDKNNVCINGEKIYINKKLDYKTKFEILIHELTHYLQCLNSMKNNKSYSSITKNRPKNNIIKIIDKLYNKSSLSEEYEAFYYQYNYLEFNDLENFVLYSI